MTRPKPPHLRQRRNRATTAATLPTVAAAANNAVPPLPERPQGRGVWHPRVIEWWEAVWRSPMAGEYLDADMKGGLYLLAELYHKFWETEGGRTLVSLASEIRQQEQRFGLSSMDRRRLQWQIEQGETAEERTHKRRTSKRLQDASAKDPRDVLRMVKDPPDASKDR